MPIQVTCACGARLTVRDEAAGRKVKCPKCASPVSIPAPEPEIVPVEPVLDVLPPAPEENRVPCPYCAEMILKAARMCPHCKSHLVGREAPPRPMMMRPRPPVRRSYAASSSSDDSLSAVDIVLGILFPCIGMIIGFVYLCSGRGARGGKLIGISLLVAVIVVSIRFSVLRNSF
jgi:hypothetical protein